MHFQIHLDAALPPECSFEQVKQAFDAQPGWSWVQRIPAGEQQLHEEIWRVDDDRGAMRYVFDHFVDVPTIRAESDIGGMVALLMEQLEPLLPIQYPNDLVRLTRSEDRASRAFALRGLAAVQEGFRGDVFRAFRDALFDEDCQMRGLALTCISRYPWFQFVNVLEEAAMREIVDVLRTEQLRLAESIRQHGKRGL